MTFISLPSAAMNVSDIQLNISHLKMICTINDCDTVKDAAERLDITQPALSNRIREAERRLDAKLFVRRGRRLIITTAGKRLLQSARKILDELSRAEQDIDRISQGIEQVIRIGIPHYASFQWLPSVIEYFAKHYPTVDLEIVSDAAKQPINALYQGEVDVVLISSSKSKYEVEGKEHDADFLHSDELVAWVNQQHEYAKRPYLLPQDFVKQTYITNAAVPEKDREYELFFKPNNVVPKKILQVGFNEAILELVKMNMGLSIFSKRLIEQQPVSSSLVPIKLGEEGIHIHWHLVHVKKDDMTEVVANLVNLLSAYFAEQK